MAEFEHRQELDKRKELLLEAMSDLNDREKEIISHRQLNDEPKTLEELSKVYKVSRERVRQIEVRAFEKLKKRIKAVVDKAGISVDAQAK